MGRYWASELRRLNDDENREWELEKKVPLLEGRLLGEDDQSFQFLLDALARWTELERKQLFRWAQRSFNDDRTSNGAIRLHDDRRPLLRETALATGSSLSDGMTTRDARTLLSPMAWFWAHETRPILLATKMKSPNAALMRAEFSVRSDPSGANPRGANLNGSDLFRTNLSGADLTQANLNRADLGESNLSFAKLRGGFMFRADLANSDLSSADLTGADLTGADLRGADLTDAILDPDALADAIT